MVTALSRIKYGAYGTIAVLLAIEVVCLGIFYSLIQGQINQVNVSGLQCN
jgi:hypothetical protein